jgi:hypothetical protein
LPEDRTERKGRRKTKKVAAPDVGQRSRVKFEASVGELGSFNAVTRHLAIGAYVDPDYRFTVIRDLYLDRARYPAPSYCFDLEPVLVHARRAWLLDLLRNAAFITLLGVIANYDARPAILVVTLLACWFLVRTLGHHIKLMIGRRSPNSRQAPVIGASKTAVVIVVAWISAVALWMALGEEAYLGYLRSSAVLARTGWTLTAIALIAMIAAICRQRQMTKLAPGARCLRQPRSKRIRELGRESRRPVTIYSGYRPFIGSGMQLSAWSFAMRLLPREAADGLAGTSAEVRREYPHPPFSIIELIRYVGGEIERLGDQAEAELRLPRITVRPRIFVPGNHSNAVLDDLTYRDLDRFAANAGDNFRYYLVIQVPSWDGEIVTTVYVYMSLQGRTLYLELSAWCLPPTRDSYHQVDRPGGVGPIAYTRSCLGELRKLPYVFPSVIQNVNLFGHWLTKGLLGRDRRRSFQQNGVDVGTNMSIRELGAALTYVDHSGKDLPSFDASFFQYSDVTKHWKIIERRVLAAVESFLLDRGVATEEYRQRIVTILNVGAIGPFGAGLRAGARDVEEIVLGREGAPGR